MKIALCISGQPRTWKQCHGNWFENFHGGHDIDTFFHFWDYNTYASRVNVQIGRKNNPDIPITEQEKEEIVTTLKPKKYYFDSRKLNPTTDRDENLYTKYVKTPIGWWCRSQFYSQWYVSKLRRQYEVENNFEYDFVLRWRTDIMVKRPIHFPDVVKPNTMYTTHNGWMNNVKCFQVGDMLFGADSFTFDQISNLVEAFNFFDTHHIVPGDINCPPPEVVIYPFIKSLGIRNQDWAQSFKTYRTQDYINIRGYVEDYETT